MAPLSDALLPTSTLQGLPLNRARIAAFVPITIALIGIGFVLVGGISARAPEVTAAPAAVDPVVTGSIGTPAERAKALRSLDD